MNKLAIPTILVATVMVAGMFAFMPVEQASTVHTSAASATQSGIQVITSGATTFDDDGQIEIECANAFAVHGLFFDATVDDDVATVDFDVVQIDETALTADTGLTSTLITVIKANAADQKSVVLGADDDAWTTNEFNFPLFATADIDFEIISTAGTVEGDAVTITAFIQGGGVCTIVTEAED